MKYYHYIIVDAESKSFVEKCEQVLKSLLLHVILSRKHKFTIKLGLHRN